MSHHTKDKGDKGVGFIIADLMSKDIQVSLLISEHLPFDIIAIDSTYKLAKIQCKYKSAVDGAISVDKRGIYPSRHGYSISLPKEGDIDIYAVYCPQTNQTYYVPYAEVKDHKNSFSLRISGVGNINTRYAKDYTDPHKAFSKIPLSP